MGSWLNLRDKIFIKFSLAFITVGLIPLFIISYLSLHELTSQVGKQTNNTITQMDVYLSGSMDNIFRKYNEVTKIMYSMDPNLPADVNENNQINHMKINDFLRTIVFSDGQIQDAIFIRKSDKRIFTQTRESKWLDSSKLPLNNWMDTVKADPTGLVISPPQSQPYFYNSSKKVMVFGRNLIDISTNNDNVIGTLFFTVDTKVFSNLLSGTQLKNNDQIYVSNQDGRILFTTDQKVNGKIPNIVSNKNVIVNESDIPFINGKVISSISKTDFNQQITGIRVLVMFVMILCILSLIVLSIGISRKFSKPILLIMKHMKKVESGNLDVRVEIKSKDEVGKLAAGFNQMVERLKSFINEAYIAEIKQKQTELNALKSQIRPHYLYNTLEVIRMSAVYNDDHEVADMIHVLSKQMKYVIDYGEEIVTINTELEHLEDYFTLIKVRFGEKVNLGVDIGPEVSLDWGIHKLSIQPIVENAIHHGIRPKLGNGTVNLIIEKIDDESLSITINDDGVGMDEQRVNEINKRLSEGYVSTNRSVGMWNVNERIKTLAGKEYGLKISSKLNVGTSVRMVIPVVREVQDKNVKGAAS
jgi:two-component system, sensor histidine kinase YesM